MTRKKFERSTTNCGIYSLYPSDDKKAWKWFRFNGTSADRGGKKDIATYARLAGFVIDGPITNLPHAKMYVDEAIRQKKVELPGAKKSQTDNPVLRDYVRVLMNPESELYSWLQGDPKSAIGLKRFKSYCSSFKLHGYDALPEDLALLNTTTDDIKAYLRKVRIKKNSEEVEFNCLQAVRKVFNYAIEERRILKEDPTKGITVHRKKRIDREILLPEELRELLSVLKKESESADNRSYSKRIYVAVNLMIHTGMRSGEIRALRIGKVTRVFFRKKPSKIFRIRVDSNWDDGTKSVKATKTDKPNYTYIWEDLAQMLFELYDEHLNPNGFIFPSDNPEMPIDKSIFYDYVYPALGRIGISDDERIERNIDIHSIRSFYITQAEALDKIRNGHKDIMESTGHVTESAHSRYIQRSFLSAYRMACLSRDLLKEDDLEEIYKDSLLEDEQPLFEAKYQKAID